MSSKFGLIDDTDDAVEPSERKIDLSGFAPVQKRSPIDLALQPLPRRPVRARTTAPRSAGGARTSFSGSYDPVSVRSFRWLR